MVSHLRLNAILQYVSCERSDSQDFEMYIKSSKGQRVGAQMAGALACWTSGRYLGHIRVVSRLSAYLPALTEQQFVSGGFVSNPQNHSSWKI